MAAASAVPVDASEPKPASPATSNDPLVKQFVNGSTIDGNQVTGREQDGKIYEITGDLWRVKPESNNCDFHLEISAPGQLKTANRIIVELPQGPLFLAARQKLIDELIANGYDPAVDKPLDLDEPLRIKVIGLPFYDSAHYSKKNPKRGHGHGTAKVGTLWELHPFWDIQFIEQP